MRREDFEYKAYISYNHADREWAKWIQSKIESFKVPKQLVGTPGKNGRVPDKLRPVFCDYSDFGMGGELGEKLTEEVEKSEFMVVVCSPRSAASKHVDNEIREFRKRRPLEYLLPVIVAGVPGASQQENGDPTQECYPPSLLYVVSADGEPDLTKKQDIAAADVRKTADGLNGALLRVVAQLLGVTVDSLKLRQLERESKIRRRFAAIIAALALVFAGLSAWLWYAIQRSETTLATAVQALDEVTDSLDFDKRTSLDGFDTIRSRILEPIIKHYDRLTEGGAYAQDPWPYINSRMSAGRARVLLGDLKGGIEAFEIADKKSLELLGNGIDPPGDAILDRACGRALSSMTDEKQTRYLNAFDQSEYAWWRPPTSIGRFVLQQIPRKAQWSASPEPYKGAVIYLANASSLAAVMNASGRYGDEARVSLKAEKILNSLAFPLGPDAAPTINGSRAKGQIYGCLLRAIEATIDSRRAVNDLSELSRFYRRLATAYHNLAADAWLKGLEVKREGWLAPKLASAKLSERYENLSIDYASKAEAVAARAGELSTQIMQSSIMDTEDSPDADELRQQAQTVELLRLQAIYLQGSNQAARKYRVTQRAASGLTGGDQDSPSYEFPSKPVSLWITGQAEQLVRDFAALNSFDATSPERTVIRTSQSASQKNLADKYGCDRSKFHKPIPPDTEVSLGPGSDLREFACCKIDKLRHEPPGGLRVFEAKARCELFNQAYTSKWSMTLNSKECQSNVRDSPSQIEDEQVQRQSRGIARFDQENSSSNDIKNQKCVAGVMAEVESGKQLEAEHICAAIKNLKNRINLNQSSAVLKEILAAYEFRLAKTFAVEQKAPTIKAFDEENEKRVLDRIGERKASGNDGGSGQLSQPGGQNVGNSQNSNRSSGASEARAQPGAESQGDAQAGRANAASEPGIGPSVNGERLYACRIGNNSLQRIEYTVRSAYSFMSSERSAKSEVFHGDILETMFFELRSIFDDQLASEMSESLSKDKKITLDQELCVSLAKAVFSDLAKQYEQAFKDRPKIKIFGVVAAESQAQLARLLLHGGKYDRSVRIPMDAYVGGRAHLEKAIRIYKETFEHNPPEGLDEHYGRYIAAHLSLARLMLYAGDAMASESHFKSAIKLSSDYLEKIPFAWYEARWPLLNSREGLGEALVKQFKFREAIQVLQAASTSGSHEASKRLETIYRSGLGVPKNLKQADIYGNLASRQSMKRFTVPVDFNGVKHPFHVYVMETPKGYPNREEKDQLYFGIDDQARWVEEARGGKVPEDVLVSFCALHKIAIENDVSFPELAVYALSAAQKEAGNSPPMAGDR